MSTVAKEVQEVTKAAVAATVGPTKAVGQIMVAVAAPGETDGTKYDYLDEK